MAFLSDQPKTKAGQGGQVLQQGKNTAKEQRTPVGKEVEEREKVNEEVSISILHTDSQLSGVCRSLQALDK